MRILKLEGELIGQHKKLGPIYFPESGLFGILGPNGAGKSTIFTAINLALFGSTSDLKASEIKNHDAKKNQKWWVELVFEIGGVQYSVLRHETTSKSFLTANGKTIQLGQTDVTEHIVSTVLQMDQTAFLNAFYGKQDEFDNLNKLTNEKRKKEISKLLKINNIDKGIDSLRTDKNVLNTQITEQSRYISDELLLLAEQVKLEENLTQINHQWKKEKEILLQKENSFQKIKDELTANEKDSEIHTELINQHQQITSSIQSIKENVLPRISKQLSEINQEQTKIVELENKLKEIPPLEQKEKELEQIKTNFDQRNLLTKQLEQNKKTLTARKEELDRLILLEKSLSDECKSIDLNQEQKNITSLNETITSLDKEYSDTNGQLSVIVSKGKENKEEIIQLRNLGEKSTCPTCQQVLGTHLISILNKLEEREKELLVSYEQSNKLMKEVSSSLANKKKELETVVRSIQEKERKLDKLTQLSNDIQIKRSEFKELKDSYFSLESQIKSIQGVEFNPQDLTATRTKLRELYQMQERVRSITDLIKQVPSLEKEQETYTNQIKEFSMELERVKTKGEELAFDKKKYLSLKEIYNSTFNEIREIERIVSTLENQETALTKEKETIVQTIEKNKTEQQLLNNRKKEFSTLLYLEEVFKNYKVDQLSKLAPAISTIMQNLLSQLTDGKYDLVELDENYNVFVYRNQIRQPLHLFSGGERKLISLVQRLAISHIIVSKTSKKKFEFLALDEVLGSMDEERQESILEGLRKLNSLFKQILMVSHNSNVHALFDYTLRVEQDTNLNTVIRWDEDWDQEAIKNQIFS